MRFIFGFVGRRTIILLLLASFTLSLFDLIGIATILPYLQILSAKSSQSLDRLNEILGRLGAATPDHVTIVVLSSAGLAAFFLAKFALVYLINRYQLRTFADITFRLNDRMFNMLMQSEYRLFLKSAGSEMIGIVHSATQHATLCFQATVTTANEIMFLLLLTVGLMSIKPAATTIAIATIGAIGLMTYLVAVKRISRYGTQQQKLDIDRQKLAFATANSIKDIKIMELENLFAGKNAELADVYRNITWRYQLLSNLPKIIIEHMFVLVFIAGTTVAILWGMEVEMLLPVLGMIGLIALRVVPGLAKVISAYNSYRYSRISMDRMLVLQQGLIAHSHKEQDVNMPFTRELSIDGVSFSYEDHEVLSDLTMTIRRGQSVGIVGPSGSGKSTLLDVITGIQKARSGAFKMDGVDIDPFETNVLKKKLGYVPQQIALLDESIAFNITFEHYYDAERLQNTLRIANLQKFVESLPNGVGTLVGEGGVRLSGGQRQRIGIARALYRNPEILVFDEATSALDNITERELSQEIQRLAGGMTIIQVAHRLTTIENCNVIHVMDKGRLVASGTHAELLAGCSLYATMCHDQEAEKV